MNEWLRGQSIDELMKSEHMLTGEITE